MDNNTPMTATDRICIIRRDADGVGTVGSLEGADVLPGLFTPGTNIADLALTGVYADDDDGIEAAVNGILAILLANGLMDAA